MALTRLLRLTPQQPVRLRLFALPYAGGGIAAYRSWARSLPRGVELCAVQPPGREGNQIDRPFTELHRLVADIREAIADSLDQPFVLFGHSMGALLTFELTRLLRREGAPLPLHLFLSGHRPPDLPRLGRPLHLLPDDQLIAELKSMGGTPEEVLSHPELTKLMLPLLRADFGLCIDYRYQEEPPLDLPLTVYGGTNDETVPVAELSGWGRQTSRRLYVYLLPGEHFFHQQDLTAFLNLFSARLQQLL